MKIVGPAVTLVFAALAWASLAHAREVLTPEEQAERELEAKRQAPPVLVAEPASLQAAIRPGEATILQLAVRNAGGRKLAWSVASAPSWLRLDVMSGELGFGEERRLVIVIEPDKIERAQLPEGAAKGKIVIAAPGVEGSPVELGVEVRVTAAGPTPGPGPAPGGEAEPDAAEAALEPAARPAAEAVPVSAPPAKEKGRFGVRGGVLVSGMGGAQDYDPSALVGLTYSPARPGGSRISYELGADFSRAGATDSEDFSDVGIARAALLFGRSAGGYLLSGLDAYLVSFNGEVVYTGGLNLGVGMPFARGKLDVRLTHSVLLGSTNVDRLTLVALGTSF